MKRISVIWLVLVQLILAVEWLHSGWGKWAEPGFINNIGKILAGFAVKNPHSGYVDFLNTIAIPNAELFGNAIRSGEILVGLGLAVAGVMLLAQKRLSLAIIWLLVLACFGGAFMNLNFFLASGWTSPSAWGVNAVMGLMQLVLGLCYITNRKNLAGSA